MDEHKYRRTKQKKQKKKQNKRTKRQTRTLPTNKTIFFMDEHLFMDDQH